MPQVTAAPSAPGASLRLVRPTAAHLPSYVAALQRGFSPDNTRPPATEEQLQLIATDPPAFLALMDDPLAKGPPVTLPDGTTRPRIPSLRRWMWLDAAADDAGIAPAVASGEAARGEFVGSIGLRWMADASPLPAHVLGHIGYVVAAWHQRRGFGTRALALMLDIARARGLAEVEITTDPDNLASQRVIEASGGVLRERFDKGAAYGHASGLRYGIDLTRRAPVPSE